MSSARGNNFGNFLNSETFSRHESYFNQLGDMNLDEIQYQQIIIDNISYDLFIVPILKNGFLMGKLEVLDLKDTPFLPNNDKYALNYADLSKYDLTSDTGKIDLYDLNFDNYLHTKIEVLNGFYVSYNGAGLSQGLKEKYASIANPNKTENLRVRNVSCDGNGNGDVTFSECYKCFSVAIQMNSTSTAICEAYHAAGLPWWGSCMSSTAAACVIISSIR